MTTVPELMAELAVVTIVFGMGTGVTPGRIATGNIRLLSKCTNGFISVWEARFPKHLWIRLYKRRRRDQRACPEVHLRAFLVTQQ